MELFARLGPFWTIGIILNLGLTALAVWWIIRSMRPREPVRGPGGPPAGEARREE